MVTEELNNVFLKILYTYLNIIILIVYHKHKYRLLFLLIKIFKINFGVSH